MSEEYKQEQTEVLTARYVNTSAIKKHALLCSEKLRSGYFNRVGESFVVGVQAEVEAVVHKLNGMFQPPIHSVVAPDGDVRNLVTGAYMGRVESALNAMTLRAIQARVQRHPTLGKTLK